MSTSNPAARYHHGDLRTALVAAARRILEDAGADAVTLRAVAAAVGVSAMAPYRHFTDKAQLLAAVAAQGFRDFHDRLAVADRQKSPRKALAAQGAAYVDFALSHPALFRLMFTGKPARDAELARDAGRAFQLLSTRVASLSKAPPPDDLVLAAWSLVHGLAVLLLDDRVSAGVDRDEVVQRLTRRFADFVDRTARGKA